MNNVKFLTIVTWLKRGRLQNKVTHFASLYSNTNNNFLNHLKPTGYVMHHQVNINPICHVMHHQVNINTTCHVMHNQVNIKPTGYVMQHQVNIQQLYALPALYLCVLYLSENKQRLVPLTA